MAEGAMIRAGALLVAAALATLVAGCAETQFVVDRAKVSLSQSGPRAGVYKVGKPYRVDGVWYYPALDYGYDASGVASWYGNDFHGKRTANGEVFDMNGISAAHQTLTMPSVVQVTNLENGRSVRVRVNDRGPFVNGRVIDVSRRVAQLLAFERQGTAPVRVRVLAEESRQIAALYQGAQFASAASGEPRPRAAPAGAVVRQSLDGSGGAGADTLGARPSAVARAAAAEPAAIDGRVSVQRVAPTRMFVQIGAFTDHANAKRLAARLAGFGRVHLLPCGRPTRGGKPFPAARARRLRRMP
jgi:rare lipoprotein A